MTIYNELFKIRKDIQETKNQLSLLSEKSEKTGDQKTHKEIENLTQKLENLKVRKLVLEKMEGKFENN